MEQASDRFKAALRDLSNALDPKGIKWAVAGAVAANQYRDQIRTTSDLDVILSLADRKIDVVLDALYKNGWTSSDVVTEWLVRAEHPVTGRLDVLISGTEYEVGAIARAKQVVLDDERTYKTLAVEDVLILKLIADRFLDNADVESILVQQPELDWDYMTKWIAEFELEERLKRIEDAALSSRRLTANINRSIDSK